MNIDLTTIKLVGCDVDGTLSTTVSGDTFRQHAQDWQWLPGRIEKLQELRAQGKQIALITNQAGVAFPWSKFSEAEIQSEIETMARVVDACFLAICYSTPNEKAIPRYYNANDRRRKPNPGMIEEAIAHCGITPQEMIYIGDRNEDEQAAHNAGVVFVHADEFFAE